MLVIHCGSLQARAWERLAMRTPEPSILGSMSGLGPAQGTHLWWEGRRVELSSSSFNRRKRRWSQFLGTHSDLGSVPRALEISVSGAVHGRLSVTLVTGGVSLSLQVANAVPSCSQTGPPENSGYWPPAHRTKDCSIA